MIFRAFTPHALTVETGECYKHTGLGALTETAHVLDTGTDKLGIPHVRFRLAVGNGATKTFIETRTLSLEAFLSRYKEKVITEQ